MAFKTIWLRQKFHILFSFSFFLSPSTIFDITHYILRFLVVQWRSKLKPEIPEMTSGITWQNWAAKRAVASATNKNQQD